MAELRLPSGRVVNIKSDITYGDEIAAIAKGMGDPAEFHYAKFAVVCPEMSRQEVAALSREDGHALAAEVNRVFGGRPEEKEVPFAKDSQPSSVDTKARIRRR